MISVTMQLAEERRLILDDKMGEYDTYVHSTTLYN